MKEYAILKEDLYIDFKKGDPAKVLSKDKFKNIILELANPSTNYETTLTLPVSIENVLFASNLEEIIQHYKQLYKKEDYTDDVKILKKKFSSLTEITI